MSSVSAPVSAELLAYVAAHTTREDALLADLKRAARDAGLPAIWISPEQGSLMQILLRLAGAREVVEVGTLGGYSAIWMARALPAGGRLRTIEIEPAHAAFAREWIVRAGLADRVEVVLGDARAVLPRFAAGSADAAFVDADKPGYPAYLAECRRILRPGGLFLADNAFAFGRLLDADEDDPDVLAVRAFNAELARSAAFASAIVPVGDGCWVGVRL